MKKTYRIVFRYRPETPWFDRIVEAENEEHAKGLLTFEDKVTHNRIEFKSVVVVV